MGPLELKTIVLIISILAGCFLVLVGAWLYKRGVMDRGEAELKGAGIEFKLSNYGPGLIATAFGAFVIYAAVTRPLTEETSSITSQEVDGGTTTTEETTVRTGSRIPPSE